MPATWSPRWEEPGWLNEATLWIDANLGEGGLTRSGPLDQFHIRPWSTVIRIPTADGAFFFKAGAPNQHMEPALLEILARVRPKDTPSLVAVDIERGWAITGDGGPTLRQTLAKSDSRAHFLALLPQYAEYQIDTMGHTREILAVGCPDRQLEVLPQEFKMIVEAPDLLRLQGGEEVLSPDDVERLHAMTPKVHKLCDQIAATGIPAAIDHGDLHTANVFSSGGEYTFFDWGDASVSHPFFSLVVTMRSIAGELNSQDPSLEWTRDAYLEPFTRFATTEELRATFASTQHLGRFQRSLTWLNVQNSIRPLHLEQDIANLPAWLWLFLHFPEEKF